MKRVDALQMVARTDPGMIRSHNEDAVLADPEIGLVILADGMGGYSAGEVASNMTTSLLAESMGALLATSAAPDAAAPSAEDVEQRLLEEISAVNTAVLKAAQSQPQYAGMGTTLVVAYFYNNRMSVAHLGDSRLYRLRGGLLEQLTRDHSLLQEQLDSGMITPEDARHAQNKNLLTRALGVDPYVDVEIHDYDMQAGDLVLLCSDGLNDMVEDEEIARVLRDDGDDLARAADELIGMANGKGGRDNVSVILVKVCGDFASHGNWRQKLLARFKK